MEYNTIKHQTVICLHSLHSKELQTQWLKITIIYSHGATGQLDVRHLARAWLGLFHFAPEFLHPSLTLVRRDFPQEWQTQNCKTIGSQE